MELKWARVRLRAGDGSVKAGHQQGGEPFFEGSSSFEVWLLLSVLLLQDVATRSSAS